MYKMVLSEYLVLCILVYNMKKETKRCWWFVNFNYITLHTYASYEKYKKLKVNNKWVSIFRKTYLIPLLLQK